MKQRIFTLIALAALVLIGGNVFGQDKFAPYVNTTHTYNVTVPVANEGDTFEFTTTASTDDIDATDEGFAAITENNGGKVTDAGLASASVTWGATAGIYNLWIIVTDDWDLGGGVAGGTGCSNYRFIEIEVSSNVFDLTIYGILVSSSPDLAGWTGNTDLAEMTQCPEFGNADFNTEVGNNDGESYVFFRVSRVAGNGTNTWGFSVATSSGGTVNYSATGADGTWSTTAPSGIASTTTEYLVRIDVTNDAANGVVVDATETGLELGYLAEITPGTTNTKTITLSTMPDLTSVSFQ